MFTILFLIAVVYLLINAWKMNIYLGIGAVLVALAYIYFKWYSDFCVGRARNVYRKDAKKAMEWFARAYKRGMNIKQLETYAYYLLREGEIELSEEIYKNILNQNLAKDTRLKIRTDYAVLLLKTGRIDEAIEELEEVTLNYTNTTIYGSLGYLYLLKNNKRRAESYNLEAYEYNSDDPVILDNLVQLYIRMEDYNEAKKYADELLEKKPYFVEAYYDSAFVYMKLGELDRAKEILEDAKNCRITFMSTVKEEDIEEFSNCLESGKEFSYKLGAFTDEVEEEKPQKLIYADDEDEEAEEGNIAIEYDGENDPFI